MTLSYEGETYGYTSFGIPPGNLFPYKEGRHSKKLMAAALDASPILSSSTPKAAASLFSIKRAAASWEFPLKTVWKDRLSLMFFLGSDYSSVFTALKSEKSRPSPLRLYKSTTGKELMTVVEAEPVFDEKGSLIGAFSVERDMKSVKTQLQVLHEVEAILMRHLTEDFTVKSDVHYTFDDFIGSSSVLRETLRLAQKMALRDMNILIEGETGTGKEILAQSIHQYSSRKKEKFIAVNCAAFPETLIDSMLFGTVKGAFTGATDKIGLIMKRANHGTLFLDEVNSMSPLMQAKLLRVPQEKTLQRIGSTRSIPIDVRILSSSNEDVYRLSQEGKMRQDLFYRLSSLILEIPPLRRRMEDLPELVQYFIDHHPHLTAQPIHELTSKFWRRLLEHDWPGNVRELFHILSYAISVSQNGILDERDFPSYFLRHSAFGTKGNRTEEMDPVPAAVGRTFAEQMDDFERNLLWNTYLSCGKNVTKAAEALGLTRQNFQYHMKKFQETESGDRLLDK